MSSVLQGDGCLIVRDENCELYDQLDKIQAHRSGLIVLHNFCSFPAFVGASVLNRVHSSGGRINSMIVCNF